MKKLLMIGMNFHDYEPQIKESIEKNGFEVDVYSDTPKRFKGYGALVPNFIKKIDYTRHQKVFFKKERKYDVVLVFVGRFLQPFFLQRLKNKNPNAKFILYLWDDLGRVENFEEVKSFYDQIISFELNDCLQYGFDFIPLYYLPVFYDLTGTKTIDLCTISTKHTDRMEIITKIVDNYSQFIKIHFELIGGVFSYIRYLFSFKRKKDKKRGLIYSLKYKSSKETAELMKKSKAILDIQHPTQKGLSNRTLEALGAKIKLVTTNEQVKYYDFYNENNICIIDRNNPVLDVDFFKSPYSEIPENIYEEYTLDEWVRAILFGAKFHYLNNSFEEIKKDIFGNK